MSSKFKPPVSDDRFSEPIKPLSQSSSLSAPIIQVNSVYHDIRRTRSPYTIPSSNKKSSPTKRQSDKKSMNGDYGETSIINGERLPKNSRIIASLGTIDELICYLGVIKSEYFTSNESLQGVDFMSSSDKMFLSAFFTKIQESLYDVINSLATSKANPLKYEESRFNVQNIKDIERICEEMKTEGIVINKTTQILSGTSVLESKLLYARAILRRAERIVVPCKNERIGLYPEESVLIYLNRLGDYFYYLSLKVLRLQSKEPLKRNKKK